MINLKNIYHVSNDYSGSDWNYEETTKYVFENEGKYLEAGYFIHYVKKGDYLEEKKHVIELPSSYGCPMKCSFCASSFISDVQTLTTETMYELFCYIYDNNQLNAEQEILVSMLGIGDLYFTIDSVLNVLRKIAAYNNKIVFSVSSCCWTEEMLKKIELLSKEVNFRSVQITYLSNQINVLRRVVKSYEHMSYDFEGIVQMIYHSSLSQIRINYIMIQGINDSKGDFEIFISKFSVIKDKIKVRISKMNDTESSRRSDINSSTIENMQEFCDLLTKQGFTAYLFYSFKNDEMNCGQLITERL